MESATVRVAESLKTYALSQAHAKHLNCYTFKTQNIMLKIFILMASKFLVIIQDVMSDEMFNIVAQGAKELNITLPPTAEAAFRAYYDFLEKRGKHVNLTALSGVEEVARLHFLDSISPLKATSFKNKRVIDIGSGAGFPGIPLKIAEPAMDLTLLEATGKKISFLSELCTELDINAECVNTRAEEAAHIPDMREQFDIAVARAVARLNELCELCLPFVRVEGFFIAMKSTDSADEAAEAQNAIATLGAEMLEQKDYKIPGTDITHRIIVIRKIQATPEKYPRRYAKIRKSPL